MRGREREKEGSKKGGKRGSGKKKSNPVSGPKDSSTYRQRETPTRNTTEASIIVIGARRGRRRTRRDQEGSMKGRERARRKSKRRESNHCQSQRTLQHVNKGRRQQPSA
jgi:hypothetical protein